MEDAVVEIEDLWFFFNGHSVLENVNLAVTRGDFMAVIGPNGGGKTTLLKLMLGLLEPARGRLRVFGLTPHKAAPRIGYMPQNTGANNGMPVTVMTVVLMGRMKRWGGWFRFSREDRAAAGRCLERVGMWDHRRSRMDELSGGQRQRVFLARALAGEPELMLLDEPTANIDSQGQSELLDLFRELNKETTIILVSHDMMVVSSYTRSVACVNRQVHFHDRPEITGDMLKMAYHCPVELVAHGLPHRVLSVHSDD